MRSALLGYLVNQPGGHVDALDLRDLGLGYEPETVRLFQRVFAELVRERRIAGKLLAGEGAATAAQVQLLRR